MTRVYPFTVTNGASGPVLWCDLCDKPIGYLTDKVLLDRMVLDAANHLCVSPNDSTEA